MKIFISGINRPLGYNFVEKLRRDHLMLQDYPLIYGSIHKTDYSILNQSIHKTFNFQKQQSMMIKTILQCDFVILDISNENVEYQIQVILKVLKNNIHFNKQVKVIAISNYMTWSNCKNLQFKQQHNDKQGLLDNVLNKNNWKVKQLNTINTYQYLTRTPHPLYSYNYQLQSLILQLNLSQFISSFIFCTGQLYGKNSQSIFDLISNSINNKCQIVYKQGQNYIPFLHIGQLLRIVEQVVYNKDNNKFKEYNVLCQQKCYMYRQIIEAINRSNYIIINIYYIECGNKAQIKSYNQIIINKKDISRSISIYIKPSLKFTQTSRDIINDIDEWFKQLSQSVQLQFKHILLSEQIYTNQQNQSISSLNISNLINKYTFLDKQQLNNMAMEILKSQQQNQQNKQIQQQKKKVNNNNTKKKDQRNSIKQQPYQTVFVDVMKLFLKQKQLSNYIICLKQQYLQKIPSIYKQIHQENNNYQENNNNLYGFVQIITEKYQKKVSDDLVRVIDIESDDYYLVFDEEKKKQQTQQLVVQSTQRNNQQNNDINPINNTQQINQHSNNIKKDSSIVQQQQPKINLFSQYLLDNLIVYIVQAKHQLYNKGILKGKDQKIQGKDKIKLFVEQLKKIRKRQTNKTQELLV